MGQTRSQSIRILGIPMDLGQQRRGVDMGPSALRYTGLYDRLVGEGYGVEDLGNLDVPVRDERSVSEHRWIAAEGGGLRHLPEIVQTCAVDGDRRRIAQDGVAGRGGDQPHPGQG